MLPFQNIEKYEEATFYGGSFNPWHSGHTACIESFPSDKKLYIVPDFNPLKEITERPTLNELTQATGRPAEDIYTGFLELKQKNPTYYWMRELQNAYPKLKLNLLLGADSFLSLKNWIEGENLVKLLHAVYVVPRLVADEDLEMMKLELQKINPRLQVVFLAHHKYEDLSSTQIRTQSNKK